VGAKSTRLLVNGVAFPKRSERGNSNSPTRASDWSNGETERVRR
jgi:hypothetical protein